MAAPPPPSDPSSPDRSSASIDRVRPFAVGRRSPERRFCRFFDLQRVVLYIPLPPPPFHAAKAAADRRGHV